MRRAFASRRCRQNTRGSLTDSHDLHNFGRHSHCRSSVSHPSSAPNASNAGPASHGFGSLNFSQSLETKAFRRRKPERLSRGCEQQISTVAEEETGICSEELVALRAGVRADLREELEKILGTGPAFWVNNTDAAPLSSDIISSGKDDLVASHDVDKMSHTDMHGMVHNLVLRRITEQDEDGCEELREGSVWQERDALLATNGRAKLGAHRLLGLSPDSEDEDGDDSDSVLVSILRSGITANVLACLVVLNCVAIGIETEYWARHIGEPLPKSFELCEAIFCTVFATELFLRIAVFGIRLFQVQDYMWNIFDCVVIGLQCTDMVVTFASTDRDLNLSCFRSLRLLRVLRITRVLRTIRFLRELRSIIQSIFNSLKCLVWTLILISVLVYSVSIFFTQFVLTYLSDPSNIASMSKDDELTLWFGTVGRTALTLFEAVSGGLSWDEAARPLMSDVSPWLGVCMCLFVAFTVFAMLNVVTGVFVQTAIRGIDRDTDRYLHAYIIEAFRSADADENGAIGWDEFIEVAETDGMKDFFKHIDLDAVEAGCIFKLIDNDGNGDLDVNEFAKGCLRLRGTAAAVDLALLMCECQEFHSWMTDHVSAIEEQLSVLLTGIAPCVNNL